MLVRVVIFLLLNFAALALGSMFTTDGVNSEWYANLNKAPWTPPGWVFGVAWTSIMLCFGFYMAFLWTLAENKNVIAILFAIQWISNVSWNPVFFKFHESNYALLLIIGLTLIVGYLMFRYFKIVKYKSVLILPYLIWLVIATSLNAFICIYN